MWFIETPIFTETVTEVLSGEEYRDLQIALLLRPEQGALIRGSGGLRKLRWGIAGSGKRGGIRVIYYWDKPNQRFYLLMAYRKNRQEDLTEAQLKALSRAVREELK